MASVSSRGSDQFVVRFPDGMRDEIKHAAAASGRSMNSEIIHRLTTWRAPSATGQLVIDVDGTQVESALRLVKQLGEAADVAFESCRRLGIKSGEVE